MDMVPECCIYATRRPRPPLDRVRASNVLPVKPSRFKEPSVAISAEFSLEAEARAYEAAYGPCRCGHCRPYRGGFEAPSISGV
jgi:hypothetical protein